MIKIINKRLHQIIFFKRIAMLRAVLVSGLVLLMILWCRQVYTQQSYFEPWDVFRFCVYENARNESRVSVVSFYFDEQLVEVYTMDGNSGLTAAGDYGKYRLGNLFELDKLEQAGGELIKDTMSLNLGMHIRDKLVWDRSEDNLKEIDSGWPKSLLKQIIWKNRFELTSLIDYFRLYFQFIDLAEKDLRITALETRPVWINEDSGGGDMKVFNPAMFDKTVGVMKLNLPEEHAVTVINETSRSGIGLTMARILEREGYNVVRVEAANKKTQAKGVSGLVIDAQSGITFKALKRLKEITGIDNTESVASQGRIRESVRIGNDFDQF